jgi:hypothetical protein
MWSSLWTFVVPGVIAVYALFDLVTGEMSGWRSRVVRGAKARVLSILLLLTTAIALVVGPLIPIDIGSPKAEREAIAKRVEVESSIREARRKELKWSIENRPRIEPGLTDDPQKTQDFLKKMEEHAAEKTRRAAEADLRVAELESQLESIQQEQSTATEARNQAARRNGVWVMALVGLVLVRSLAWLAGDRQSEPPVNSPPDAPG